MRHRALSYRRITRIAFLAAVAACADVAAPTAPDAARTVLPDGGARGITVMTRNLYLGADIDALLTAPVDSLPFFVTAVWSAIQATNFPERATSLTAEILATQPHLIGLQEVTIYRLQSPSDIVLGQVQPNASAVVYDFLNTLLDSLSAHGAHYYVAAKVHDLDVEVPMFTGSGPIPFDDVRYTEYDVILARADVSIGDTWERNYAVNVPLEIGGLSLNWKRGYVAVEATVNQQELIFASTHLEVQMFLPVPELQAQELIAFLSGFDRQVIAVGDFNSAANPSAPAQYKTQTYSMLLAAGFDDVWARAHDEEAGLTCCHADDLRSPAVFDQRLDLVLVKHPLGAYGGVQAMIVGEEPEDRTPSGLWPSDHAGLVATLHLPAAN